MSKTRNFLTGALVGLSLSGTPTPAKAQKVEASKKDLKETLAAQGNLQEKAIDFQQIRKSGESRNIAGEHLVLNDQGVQDYFAQYGTVPYLKNSTTIEGNSLADKITSRHMRFFGYLSNNDTIYFNPGNLTVSNIDGAGEMIDGVVRVYGHCVIDLENHQTGGFGDLVINNGANFTERGSEGKEIAHTDTLYVQEGNFPAGLSVDLIKEITDGKELYDEAKKIKIPFQPHDPEYVVGFMRRKQGGSVGFVHEEWEKLYDDNAPLTGNIALGEEYTLDEIINVLPCESYKEATKVIENIGGKNYEFTLKYYSVKPVGNDGSTATSSLMGGVIPGNNLNFVTVSVKEVVNYGTTVENYNSTHIEAPKYYSESSIVDKDSLEVGKTYQVKLEAKDGFEITKVIINGEEKALGNGMVDFVAKKENTLSIDSKELLQYATITENYDGNQVESPRYYEGETEIHKEKLEIGKTYQVRLEAKDGFKITKVIINGEEKVLENGMVDFVVKKENTLEVQSEVTSGIEDKEIKKPRISLENGELTVDTQDSTIKTVQIYNLGGQLLHQRANLKGSESFVLNPGVYIVKYGLEAVKVVVK